MLWYLRNFEEDDSNSNEPATTSNLPLLTFQSEKSEDLELSGLVSKHPTTSPSASASPILSKTKKVKLPLPLVECLSPLIATRTAWPPTALPMQSMRLAPPLQALADEFGSFYRQWPGHASKHAKLLWCPTAGTVQLAFMPSTTAALGYQQREVQVVVSTPQACLLLLFTRRRTNITFREMVSALQLPPPQVYHELRSLLAPNQQVVVPAIETMGGAASVAGGGFKHGTQLSRSSSVSSGNLWRLPWSVAKDRFDMFATAFHLNEAFLNAPLATNDNGSTASEGLKSLSSSSSAGSKKNVVVVHGVQDDAQFDFLSDAAAAAALFGWRAQVMFTLHCIYVTIFEYQHI